MACTPMFIHREHALQLLTAFDVAYKLGTNKKEDNKTVDFAPMTLNSGSSVIISNERAFFRNAKPGTIAVVPINGAMMRDDYCNEAGEFVTGTRNVERLVTQLANDDNISSIVFQVNSPGGQALGNASLSRVIKSVQKPTITYFDGMASAAVYSFQGVNEIYASEREAYWGSIGTFVTLIDDRAFWEQAGINLIEIYADQSTEKNKEFRDAINNGDTEAIKERLNRMTESFIKDVQESRPQLKDDGLVFKGKLYNAAQAKKIGAIDGIKSFNQVLERAEVLARKHKREKRKDSTNNFNNNSSMTDTKKGSFFDMFFGNKTAEEATQEIEKAAAEKLELEKSINQLTEEAGAKIEKIEALTEQNGKLLELNNSLESSNTDLKNRIAALEKQVEEQKADLANLEGTSFDSVAELKEDYNKVLQHNKELGAPERNETPINNEETTSKGFESLPNTKQKTYQDVMNEILANDKKTDQDQAK